MMRTRDFKVGKRVRMSESFREDGIFPFLITATGTITSIGGMWDDVATVKWDEDCRTDKDNDPVETTVHRSNLELLPTGS